MHDLCEEEIYFWTFLNLVLFGAALIMVRRVEMPPAAMPDTPARLGKSLFL